jgi:6-pyruvoyl-tetrahydropterin synthase
MEHEGMAVVRHNIEVAHRLFDLKGKCEQIHGHSMWIELGLYGAVVNGLLASPETKEPFEFGAVKKEFRKHLDLNYDHRLLLNARDPFAEEIQVNMGPDHQEPGGTLWQPMQLPGLVSCDGDPTTENIALWVAEWGAFTFKTDVEVKVNETVTNAAHVVWNYTGMEVPR